MDLMLNSDDEQIVEAASGVLAKELPVTHARWEHGAGKAPDRAALKTFAELGWYALGLPEAAGGAGFTVLEEMLLFREAGRFLVTPILLGGVIAARLSVDQGRPDIAAAIVAGETRCGLAVKRGNGASCFLIDGDGADFILLVTERSIALLEAGAFTGATESRGLDDSVVFQTADLTGTAMVETEDAVDLDHLSLLIAAQLVGASEAVRDMTVAHACERVQFGQKIGTFQAVSHPLADMAVRCEAALSQVKFAAVTLRDGLPGAAFHIAAARVVSVNAALTNASVAIQLHGGMGFAAEYPVHHFLKRAHLLDQLGGSLTRQLDHLMALELA